MTDGGDASPPQPREGDAGYHPLPGSGARLPGSSTDPPSPSNVLQNENEPYPQESVVGSKPPPPQESVIGSEPPTPQESMVVNEPPPPQESMIGSELPPPQESMIVNEPLPPQESLTLPPVVGFSASTGPLPDAAGTEYPTYIGLSAPGRKSLTWRPYTMHFAYLLFQVAALVTTVAILLWLPQRSNYGFSERSFQGYSWRAVAMFKITPAAIALAFQLSWFAIDQNFKRMMPFINMANPKIGRRGCFGNRNSRPGARGRQSLVAYYYPYMSYTKDLLAGFQDRAAVSTSTLIYFICMGGVILQVFLFQPRIYIVPVPVNATVNANSGSQFWRIATWQQRLDHSYATGVAKKLAVSELGLVLAQPTKRSRQSRDWWGGTWAALPFVLGRENGTMLFTPTSSEWWRADTVVFHGSLDCEPAGAQTQTRDGDLVVSFRDSAGCSAQQLFPAPPAGQFLSFWNTSSGGGPECRSRQLIAWGSAMSPSSVSWNTISCAPKYQTASVPVFLVGSEVYLSVHNAEHMYTSNITKSEFPTAASEFSSPGLTGLINQVFFDTGFAATGLYPANQAPFFRGYPALIRTIDNPKGLLDRSTLIASAQRSFEQVSSRIFAVALSTTNPAPVGSLPTTAASNGVRYILVERWGLLPTIPVIMMVLYSTALCGAIGLLLSVALMRKYRKTGLKFDITTAGTAGLMLLLHRSGRVLDKDFTDLDQSTRNSELTERLGEKLYRLGYWQDARGLFWGISREAGEEGIASEKPRPYSHIFRSHAGTSEGAVNIPRIPSGKFDSFRHRRSRPDLHPFFIVILFGLSIGFACICLYLVIQSRRHQGLDPIVNPESPWRMSLLWASLPSTVTLFIFSFWWRNVDMYFRCTQPFVNMPGPANENIAADYRTTLSIYLPFTAAAKRQWNWFLVSCATLLMPVMIGFGGALFVFGFPITRVQAQFRHTHTWRTDSFATPNLEQYLYESANLLFGADTRTSWTDPLGLHLPLEVAGGPGSSANLTTPIWHVDTQRVSANFSRCIPLDIETDLSIKTRRITVNGTTGGVVDSVELANVKCPSGTTISPPCVPSRDNSTSPAPEGLCSVWKLLPSSGGCDYDGWWWLYWQFGDVFASDATGQPVFALSPPPLAVSFLCETSIWLQDVSFSMNAESKIVPFQNITVKRTEVFDSVDRDYKNTFNSLLNTTLAEIRNSSDSIDLTAVLMESLAINRTNISSTFSLGSTASFLYGAVFGVYTRNEEILWAPLSNERGPPPTSNGSISWHSVRVTARPHSVGLYIACILIIIITIAIAAPSLKWRKLPRVTNCLASEITYFYRSPVILEDFFGLDQDDVPDTDELVRRLMLKNRRYVFGEGIGRDGVPFIGIGDESYMRYRGRRGNKGDYVRQEAVAVGV